MSFPWRVVVKPAIALLALFVVACAGGDSSPGAPGAPEPPGPPGPPDTPVPVDGGQLFTYGNAVALLPTGIAEYRAAIVFLPRIAAAARSSRRGTTSLLDAQRWRRAGG